MVAGLQNRSSVMAVVKETTEATPKKPLSAANFIAIQNGFQITPQFEELQSEELQAGSIGRSKSVLGSENPTASFSHYLRHSGVEGQAPNYAPIIEALFGKETIAGVEYATLGGSTVKILKVANGANFRAGQALLVKDAAGFSIRNISKIVGNDLYLAQDLTSAPGAGVNLGKAVQYEPAVEDHPTVTIWNYRANGGALEVMSGGRSLEMSLNIQAGQQINASFNMGGVEYFFNPIEVLASKTYLDFLDEAVERAVSVPAKLYKDAHDLAEALQIAMNALGSANEFTVKYSDTLGKFTFTSNGAVFSVLWNSGDNTANSIGETLGFLVAADDSGALTYTADSAISFAAPFTPSYDSAQPLVAKGTEVMLGGEEDITCFGASTVNFRLGNTKADIPDLCEESGKSGSIINEREVTIDVQSILKKYDTDKFKRFRKGESTMFTFNAGEKVGGNWKPGRCINLHLPTATITAFSVGEQNGLCVVNMTLRAFVDNGKAEVFLNFV